MHIADVIWYIEIKLQLYFNNHLSVFRNVDSNRVLSFNGELTAV